MRRPSSADDEAPRRGPRSRLPGWLLVAPLPLSTALLAAVHPTPRAVAALVSAGVGLAVWRLGSADRLARGTRRALGMALGAWALGALALVPVGPGLRASLQGELGAAVDGALALVGGGARPLAVDLPAVVEALGWAGAMLALAAGTATAAHSRRRRLRLAWAVVGTAAATAALGFAQRALGAETILWITDVPAVRREPFFATFVNPNHAGTLLAAGAVLGASMLGRQRPTGRLLGGGAAALCLVGVGATGSRGALLSAAVGLVVLVLLAAPPRLALGAAALAGVGGLTAALTGGRGLAERLSRLVDGPGGHGDVWSGRLEFWGDALDLVAQAPLLGVGPGGYDLASRWAKTSPRFIVPRHAHMEPLQALVEGGVPAGLLWTAAALVPVGLAGAAALALPRGRRRTLQAGWLGAAAALLIACAIDFPLRIGALSVLGALTWGVLAAERSDAPAAPRRLAAPVLLAGLAGLLVSLAPLRDGLAPGSAISPGAAQLAEADEARRQARDLHLLEMDDSEPWRRAARDALGDRVRARPLDAQPLLRLAQLELDAGRPADARPILEAAAAVQPTLPWPWLGLARAADADGDVAAARTAWRTGLALNLPDNDDALPWIERALSAGSGLEHWDAVMPERADRLRDAGVLLARRGERDAAEHLFARGAALDPRVGVPWARWLLAWGEPAAALQRLEGIEDRGCPTLRVRGEAMLAAGDAEGALPWLVDARAACGEDPRLERTLALARAAARDAGAGEALEAWLEANPADHAARRALLAWLRARSEWDRIAPHIEALVDAGVATEAEAADLPRARMGLPLR